MSLYLDRCHDSLSFQSQKPFIGHQTDLFSFNCVFPRLTVVLAEASTVVVAEASIVVLDDSPINLTVVVDDCPINLAVVVD